MKVYDLIVVGSGAGSKVSVPAIHLGKKVAIVEKAELGGVCLNRGCIPSKMLIYPAEQIEAARNLEKFGAKAKIGKVYFKEIIERINATVSEESEAIRKRYVAAKNFDFYPYEARFISDKVLQVGNTQITARKIVLATGARPRIPDIEGLEGTPFMTSTQALKNKVLPKKLIVIGGGYIACELGAAYAMLGSEVEFIVRTDLISHEDKDIREEFTKVFTKRHTVHLDSTPLKVEYKRKQFTLTYEHKGKRFKTKGDALLVAVGVVPNTDDLGLDKTRIRTNKRGFIEVDDYLETSVKGVYALGDVIGKFMFRHAANFQGEYLFENLYKRIIPRKIKYPPMPHAMFTQPEFAGVGVTEDELIKLNKVRGKDYVVGLNPYQKSAMGMARLSDHGFCKLIFDRKKRLIGAHIIGDEAATMIHQLIYAMTKKAKLDDLLEMIYIHPALPEIVRNAARNAREAFMSMKQ
ncbi:dihydrolipoyl dehydrogenase [Candidatus Woesearchaeota archaeon]|nr:MAG: dihydrolipoyl dehydrogenase [Candidatus Woesearchaeota archaeon]